MAQQQPKGQRVDDAIARVFIHILGLENVIATFIFLGERVPGSPDQIFLRKLSNFLLLLKNFFKKFLTVTLFIFCLWYFGGYATAPIFFLI